MDSPSNCEIILSKINEYHRLTINDSDTKIKNSIQEILHLWPDILIAGDTATDDELFNLNVSRAVLTQVFSIVLSKDFFNQDLLLIREIFFSCFNILITHVDIFINNQSIFINSNVRLLMKMITSIISLVPFKHGDLTQIGDHELLVAMREHIDQDSKHDNLTDGIISLIWNLSDRTILVPILLKAGYGYSVIEWIKSRERKFRDDKLDAPIHILHNLSRHDDGIDQLNSLNALKVIEDITISSHVTDDNDDMAIHIAMIRALLTDINQIKFDSMKYSNTIVNQLIELCLNAAKNDRYRHNGSHVSEPLTVLVKLFYNDDILNNNLSNNQTIIELLTPLLIKFYSKINLDSDLLESYTCVVILNLIWLISNHEKYHELILIHRELMDLIKTIANEEEKFIDIFMPRTMKSIKQSVNNILTNLNQ